MTVLAYHRITDPHAPGFDTFKPNVSATPQAFAAQIDFMRRHFHIVSLGQVLVWLQGQHPLPPQSALITFDDGYYDNLQYALPVLQQRRLPAAIFLATNYIGNPEPFYWDLIAYTFYHTTHNNVNLPYLGRQHWSDVTSRAAVVKRWVECLKILPDQEKWTVVKQLPHMLNITVPVDAFAGLHLSWEDVRSMAHAGFAMGAHTQSHPILSRVSLEQARAEVVGSKNRLEAELGRPVTTFAFPNGQPGDFTPELQDLLRETGFEAAFILLPGPARLAEVRQAPLAIRRIAISYKDNLPRFAAKVWGWPRWFNKPW
ncbi:MAG: polysaccharide deacetylase family protein [Anaerolineae bacterium]